MWPPDSGGAEMVALAGMWPVTSFDMHEDSKVPPSMKPWRKGALSLGSIILIGQMILLSIRVLIDFFFIKAFLDLSHRMIIFSSLTLFSCRTHLSLSSGTVTDRLQEGAVAASPTGLLWSQGTDSTYKK